MKKTTAIFFLAIFIFSCAPQRETVRPPKEPAPLTAPPVAAKPEPPGVTRQVLSCEEKTGDLFNRTGIEIMPFVRLAFFDMDGDGRQEMIAGSKDGTLRLYRRTAAGNNNRWELVEGYFSGIKVGAFSAPAVGDIDLDNRPEVIVGTGGFSSDSGRVLIFRNSGTSAVPVWEKIEMPAIDVGDDAAPSIADVDGDARPDLVIGNSAGSLFLYRNTPGKGKTFFTKDPDFFRGVNIGMYGMPAAASGSGKLHIVAGNSMGRLFLLERRRNGTASWQKIALKPGFSSFASPAFMQDRGDPVPDLVVSDGSGFIHYYRNSRANYREWDEVRTFFAGRIMPGPVCSPASVELEGRSCLITGNMNGELKMFEFEQNAEVLPWVERPNFFRGIKLSGFARGVMTVWNGRSLLITGQQDGPVRAFLNTGNGDEPIWKEQKDFFRGIPKIMHASPTVFDLDSDGRWELIVGDVDGRVTGYRMEVLHDGGRYWNKIEDAFSRVRADRYAAPALVRNGGRTYLFVGQQDGGMKTYSADNTGSGFPVFQPGDTMNIARVGSHSSPSAVIRDGVIEMSVGDYDGNLRHFACRNIVQKEKQQ